MTKIYRDSFRYFLASLPALLAFGALIEVLLWVLQPKSETSVTFVGLTIVAYYFHRHFLFGEGFSLRTGKPANGAPPFKFGWFMLVSGALILLPVGLGLGLAFGYLDRPSPAAMLLIFFPVYLVTLSLFGTALPATVARDNTYHISQGLRATFSTMWRLVLGPGVVGVVILVATVVLGRALGSLGVTQNSLVTLAYYTVIRTLGFLTTIFAVAVLCEMYQRTRPSANASARNAVKPASV
jgi:hypothetical protein